MVALDTWVVCVWDRCQLIVSAPASKPRSVNCFRSLRINSAVAAGVAVGDDRGRRDRGWNAASHSASYRVFSF